MIFKAKSPTRVDLAGGTLDMWPLYNFVNGACTVNLAISIFTYADLKPREDQKIILTSSDVNLNLEFANLNELLASNEAKTFIYKPILQFFNPKLGFELTTRSESPVGGGLGGSSSLMISILKVFSQWLNYKFKSTDHMVQVAHNMEASILTTPTGTQDYYPAATGGLSVIDFSFAGISSQALPIGETPLKDHLSLVYTGKAHHSGLNNFEVLKNAVQKDKVVLESLNQIKNIAEQMKQVCLNKDWAALPKLFAQEYKARVLLCEAFSSPEIDQISQIALQAGADAIKICGAGGGGCIFVWRKPELKDQINNAIEAASFKVLEAQPVDLL